MKTRSPRQILSERLRSGSVAEEQAAHARASHVRKALARDAAEAETRKRAARIPTTSSRNETEFVAVALKRGFAKFVRDGWPDFVAIGPHQLFVEVKAEREQIRPAQRVCFAMLGQLGAPVFVWCPAAPGALFPWEKWHQLTLSERRAAVGALTFAEASRRTWAIKQQRRSER